MPSNFQNQDNKAPKRTAASDTKPNGGNGKARRRSPETDDEAMRDAIVKGAFELGIDPVDYATAISYETGETFNPQQPGPVTQWGQHIGTIQYGEPQRKQYGVTPNQSFEEQVTKSNVKYLKDRGVKPGATFEEIYAAINAGNAKAPLTRREKITGRSVADNIALAKQHREKVIKRFGFNPEGGNDFVSQFLAKKGIGADDTTSIASDPQALADAEAIKDLLNRYASGGDETKRPARRGEFTSGDLITPLSPEKEAAQAAENAKPITESAYTLMSQLESALDPQSPKSAVLFTDAESVKTVDPKYLVGLDRVITPHGVLYVNTGKIPDYRNKTLAEMLGFVEDVGDKTSGGYAVRSIDPETGRELFSAAVTNMETARKQQVINESMFPGSKTEIVTADEVKQGRVSDLLGEFRSQPGYAGYKKYIDEVGGFEEGSPESIKAFNETMQLLADSGDLTAEQYEQSRMQPERTQRPSQTARPQQAQTAPREGAKGGIQFSVETPKEIRGSARQYYLDDASRQTADKLGIDYEIAKAYLGNKGFAESPGTEADFTKTYKSGKAAEFELDAAAVNELRAIDAEYKEKKEKEAALKEEYLKTVDQNQDAPDLYTANLEQELLAKADAGLMTRDEAYQLWLKSKEAVEEWKTDTGFFSIFNTEDEARLSAGLKDVVSAALSGKIHLTTDEDAKKAYSESFEKMLRQYGSPEAWLKAQIDFKKRFQDSPKLYAAKQIESAIGGAIQAPFEGAAAILESIAIVEEAAKRAMLIPSFGEISAEKQPIYDFGQTLRDAGEAIGKVDKDFKDGNAEFTGNVIGQILAQVGLGVATGGAVAPALFAASLGMAGTYRDIGEFNKEAAAARAADPNFQGAEATPWQRLGASFAAAAFASPEYFIFKYMQTGATGLGRLKFVQSLRNSMTRMFVEKGAEKAAAEAASRQAADGIMAKIIETAKQTAKAGGRAAKAGLGETAQEVSENHGNNLVAYITYDPSPERWERVISLQDEDIPSAIGGFLGGALGAGIVQLRQRASFLSESERVFAADVIRSNADRLPEEFVEDALEALEKALPTHPTAKPGAEAIVKETKIASDTTVKPVEAIEPITDLGEPIPQPVDTAGITQTPESPPVIEPETQLPPTETKAEPTPTPKRGIVRRAAVKAEKARQAAEETKPAQPANVLSEAKEKRKLIPDEGQKLREPRKPAGKTYPGTKTKVRVPDTKTAFEVRYTIREIEDVIPSHNPFNFQPNPDYYFINDRHYDVEQQYQEQVRERARDFDAGQVVNNSTTSDVGPPIIDSDGNVLGGNSRTMILHRVFKEGGKQLEDYKTTLLSQLSNYGIKPEKLSRFKNPVLVREIQDDSIDKQAAITDFNKPAATPLTAAERGIAESRRMTEDALDYINVKIEAAGPEATLAEALNESGLDIVNKLIADNVFTGGERNALINASTGRITEDGRKRIERLLLGHIFDDLQQFNYAPPFVKQNIQRAIVPLTQTQTDADWDLLGVTREAIDLLTEHRAKGKKQTLEEYAANTSLARPQGWSKASLTIAQVLQRGPNAVSRAFKGYAKEFNTAKLGDNLFGAIGPDEAFNIFFGEKAEPLRSEAPISPDDDFEIEFIDTDEMPGVNASGESAASAEAISRQRSERAAGLRRVVVDVRNPNVERPLIGADAVDYVPRPNEVVFFRGGTRDTEIIDRGLQARSFQPAPRQEIAESVTLDADNADAVLRQAAIHKAVGQTLKSLVKLMPDVQIILHNTEASYLEALGIDRETQKTSGKQDFVSRGFFDNASSIHINLERANNITVYHEAAHAVIAATMLRSPELLNKQVGILKQKLPSRILREYLEQVGQYKQINPEIVNEEILVRYMADVAAGKYRQNPSIMGSIRRFFTSMLYKVGLTDGVRLKSNDDIITFAAKFKEALDEGRPLITYNAAVERAAEKLRQLARKYYPDGYVPMRLVNYVSPNSKPVTEVAPKEELSAKGKRLGLESSFAEYIWERLGFNTKTSGNVKKLEETARKELNTYIDRVQKGEFIVQYISDSVLQLERKIAFNEGRNEAVEEYDKILAGDKTRRAEMLKQLQETQSATFNQWIAYLNNNPEYSNAFKYYVLRELVEKIKHIEVAPDGTFSERIVKRGPDTIAGTVAMNPAAVAAFQSQDTADFWGIYPALAKEAVAKELDFKESLTNTDGRWIVFPQGSDANKLSNFVQGCPWCTASASHATTQLASGDFYVFATKNKKGEYAVPRIAIRMASGSVAEVRGVADKDQNLEPEMLDEARNMYMALPGGAQWEQIDKDMRRLTAIYDDNAAGKKLSGDDLSFLYEIDRTIEGFGYSPDQRIEMILKSRDERQDLADIFNVKLDEVRIGEVYKTQAEQVINDPTVKIVWGRLHVPKAGVTTLGKHLRYVTEVKANNSALSDTGALTNVGILDIQGTRVKSLGNIKTADKIYAANSALEDTGALENVRVLDIQGTRVKSLGNIKTADEIVAANSALSDTGALENVRVLDIEGTQFLKSLGNIKTADEIVAANSALEDIGALETTDYLNINNTFVTSVGNVKNSKGELYSSMPEIQAVLKENARRLHEREANSRTLAALPKGASPEMKAAKAADIGTLAASAKFDVTDNQIKFDNVEAYGMAAQITEEALDVDLSFFGLALSKRESARVLKTAREFHAEMGADYTAEEKAGVGKLIEALEAASAAGSGTFTMVLHPDAALEENVHSARFQIMATEYVKDSQSPEFIKSVTSNPLFQKAADFLQRYSALSDEIKVIEFIDKMIAGNFAELNLDPAADKEAILDLFEEWHQDFAEVNGVNGQIDLKNYDNITETANYLFRSLDRRYKPGSAGTAATQESAVSDTAGRQTEPPGEARRNVGDNIEPPDAAEQQRTEQGEQLKERKTIKNAHEYGLINKYQVGDELRYYVVYSKDANKREAQEYIDRVGFDAAFAESLLPAMPGNMRVHGSLQMAVLQLLDRELKAAVNAGNDSAVEFYEQKMRGVYEKLAITEATDAGQFISQLSEWNITNPHTIVNYVRFARMKNGLGINVPPEMLKQLEDAAREKQNADAEVRRLQAELEKARQESEKERQEKATTRRPALGRVKANVLKTLASKASETITRLRENGTIAANILSSVANIDALFSAANERLAPLELEILEDLRNIGAWILLDKWHGDPITVEQFQRELLKVIGDKFTPYVEQIHAESVRRLDMMIREEELAETVELLRLENPDKTDAELLELANKAKAEKQAEQSRRAKIRAEHKRIAKYYFAPGTRPKTNQEKVLEFIEAAEGVDPNADPKVVIAAVAQKFDGLNTTDELTRFLRQRFPERFEPKISDTPSERKNRMEDVTDIIGRSRRLFKEANKALTEKKRAARDEEKGITPQIRKQLDEAKAKNREATTELDKTVRQAVQRKPGLLSNIATVLRSSKVALIQTAMTNLLSTTIESKLVEAPIDTIDIALQRAFPKLENEGLSAEASITTAWYVPGDKSVFDKGVADFMKGMSKHEVLLRVLDDHPEFFIKFFGDVSPDFRTGVRKTLDKLMIPMRVQEFFMRDMAAFRALAQRAIMKGLNLNEIIKNNEYDAFTKEDVAYALKRSLTLTYALRAGKSGENGLTDRTFGAVVSAMRRSGFLDLIGSETFPFVNFMFNTVNKYKTKIPVMAQARLIGKTAALAKRLKDEGEPDYIIQAVKNNWTSTQIANQMWGVIALGIMMAAVRSLGDKEEWYLFRIPWSKGMLREGGSLYFDIRTQPMLAPFAFIAKKMNRIIDGKDMFTYGNPYEDLMEGFLGTSYRQAIEWNQLFDTIYYSGEYALSKAKQEEDIDRTGEKAAQAFQKWIGNEFATLTNFLQFKTVKDIAAQLDDVEKRPLNLANRPFLESLDKRVPASRRILQDLLKLQVEPYKDFATGEEKVRTPFPALKVLGFNLRDGADLRNEPTQAEILANKLRWGTSIYKRPILPDEKRIAQIKRDFRRAGEKLDPKSKEAAALAKKLTQFDEDLSRGQIQYALKTLFTSDLEDNFNALDFKKAYAVWQAATPEERKLLKDALQKKLVNAVKDKSKSVKDREKANELIDKEFPVKSTPPPPPDDADDTPPDTANPDEQSRIVPFRKYAIPKQGFIQPGTTVLSGTAFGQLKETAFKPKEMKSALGDEDVDAKNISFVV